VAINLSIYDKDFVNPLPHVFDGIAVVTPPKNASSYINRFFAEGYPTWEDGYSRLIGIKRDPINRWVSTINQMKGRVRWDCWDNPEEDISFWDSDPNDIIKNQSVLWNISEFTPQSNWVKIDIPEKYYVSEVDTIVLPMLNLSPNYETVYRNETGLKNISPITENDLTERTKALLKSYYEKDYLEGWA